MMVHRQVLSWNMIWLIASATLAVSVLAGPTVNLSYAQYEGSYDTKTNMTSFLGIRYAAPPVGNLRFQAPQPPSPQSGVQLATRNPDSCYQTGWGDTTGLVRSRWEEHPSWYQVGWSIDATTPVLPPYPHDKRQNAGPTMSEDCLFLNVFVPGTIPTKPVTAGGLPVLVWIHGGGYGAGSATSYNGANLVRDSLNNVLVVVIQYRMGAFGFLAGNEVKAHGALNAGLLDQNFALQWVQKYIGLFGGDKAHVTIWGESAGGGSVLQHMVAHGGNTQPALFNAAITSSTYLPPQYQYNHRISQSLYDKVVASTKCGLKADSFACLQAVSANTLQIANLDVASSGFYHTFVFVPVVDGTFIVERPTVTLGKGKVNGQVLLAVNNQDEGYIFVNVNQTLTITEYISRLFPDMTTSQVQAAADVYKGYGSAVEQAIAVMGDSIFVCPTYYPLKTFSGRAWKGLFAIPPAHHGDDQSYYFDMGHPPAYNNTQFIAAFSQSFLSFAKNYDVNKKIDPATITPAWNKYNVNQTEMLFNRTEAGVPVVKAIETDLAVLKRCAFWATMTAVTAQ